MLRAAPPCADALAPLLGEKTTTDGVLYAHGVLGRAPLEKLKRQPGGKAGAGEQVLHIQFQHPRGAVLPALHNIGLRGIRSAAVRSPRRSSPAWCSIRPRKCTAPAASKAAGFLLPGRRPRSSVQPSCFGVTRPQRRSWSLCRLRGSFGQGGFLLAHIRSGSSLCS